MNVSYKLIQSSSLKGWKLPLLSPMFLYNSITTFLYYGQNSLEQANNSVCHRNVFNFFLIIHLSLFDDLPHDISHLLSDLCHSNAILAN